MRKSSASLRNLGTYTSPGTPEYGDKNVGEFPKGWSSERVPLPSNSSRKQINSAALMPFYSARALPSKWDDAERWISSPVSAYSVSKNSVVQPQRRPKSKSGPLGTPGLMYLPNYSPPVMALEGGSARNFMAGSPFTTGVLLPDGISLQYGANTRANSISLYAENCTDRSSKIPQYSDVLSEPSIPSSQDGNPDGTKQSGSVVSRVVSRRDMGTQMSPDGSTHSSPGRRSSCSTFPPPMPSATEQHANHSCKVEVRDVQVDKGTDIKMQFRKHGPRKTKRGEADIQKSAPLWEIARATRDTSILQREEAKIAAWENLQKAKAEAAMRKLEIKIEKKRSESTDKILSKLRVAQLKAQEMRSCVAESHTHQRTSKKAAFYYKYVKMGYLRACFLCHTG